jgi:hypothetical protein
MMHGFAKVAELSEVTAGGLYAFMGVQARMIKASIANVDGRFPLSEDIEQYL